MIKRLFSSLRKWLTPAKGEINTVFFSAFLIFVISMSLSHFFLWKTPLTGIPLFFFLHAIGQCILEVGLLLLVGFLMKRWMRKWIFHAFIGFSFALLLAHFADFQVIRLMDASLSYICKYFFGSGLPHVLSAFQALNMNWTMIALFFSALFLIPLLGIGLYRVTEPLSKKIPWNPSIPRLILTLFATGASLLTLDLLLHPFLNHNSYHKFQKTLPLGTTFLSPNAVILPLPRRIASARNEEETRQHLLEKKLSAAEKPNIYLFIIETLRKDFLDDETAPHLMKFAHDNIAPQHSFANANSTHPSWFAILHSNFPYHWTKMQKTWQGGSLPLHVLKNSGYKIRVYSSSDLSYFKMDELLFGKGKKLIDQMEDFNQVRFIEPSERDERAIDALIRDLGEPEGQNGNLCIVFFDATHSEYSIPTDFPLKFQPATKEIDYLLINKDNVEPLKNRYRNAIFYIDSLMGRFFETLHHKNLYTDAIIAITGDHGEEFFEDGALFHGTHLNHAQTNVPIFYKFQKNPWIPATELSTHLDIFPSIIHHLTGRSDFEDLFDGKSIFSPKRSPYRLTVLQNGPKTPVEFSLSSELTHFHFRFPTGSEIYQSQKLEILKAETPLPEISELLGPLLESQ